MAKRNDDPICLRAALVYAERHGFYIFPARLEGGAKASYLSAEHAPEHLNWGMTRNLEQLRKNFSNPRWRLKCGVGIPTGEVNGIFVCETDTVKGHGVDGAKALRALEKTNGRLPKTLMARSPSGSIHRYYRHPGGIRLKSMAIAAGVDVKADSGMVIAPPSKRADGAYKWINPDQPIADAPQWLIDLIEDKERPTSDGNGHDVEDPWKHAIYDPLSEEDITEGCKIIAAGLPNPDHDWDTWNTNGLKIFHTAPDDRGYAAFYGYSERSSKFDAETTRKKWQAFHRSPPTNISAGSFIHLVRMAEEALAKDEELAEEAIHIEENFVKGAKPKTNGAAPPTKDTGPPVDLWDSFPTPELPPGLLPPIIEAYARAHSKQMGSDPAGLAMGALVACSAVIPDSIKIQPLKHNPGFTQSARLWVALVGPASTLKSPIFRVVMHAISRIDRQLIREYMQRKEAYDQLSAEEKRTTPPPRMERLKIEDATIEVVQEIAADSPNGLIMTKDELSTLFGSMEQYSGKRGGANPARGFYLQAYDGGGYTYDRIKRGSHHIDNLSINVFGGIQPDVIRDISWSGADDGLIERIISIVLRKGGIDQDVPLSPEAKIYEAMIDQLYKLRNYHNEEIVKFDDEALKVREEVRLKHHQLIEIFESANRRLASHFGKYNGMFYRLCLLWHIIEHHEDAWQSDIDADTARRVARFMHEFMMPHAVAFYLNVLNVGDEHDRLVAVAGYILAHKSTEVSNRDVQRSLRTFRHLKHKDIEGVFEQLQALSWLDRLPPKKYGVPPRWTVNPQVHELFDEKAKQEIQRRALVREQIRATVLERRHEQDKTLKRH